jgi:hypothetical protein
VQFNIIHFDVLRWPNAASMSERAQPHVLSSAPGGRQRATQSMTSPHDRQHLSPV